MVSGAAGRGGLVDRLLLPRDLARFARVAFHPGLPFRNAADEGAAFRPRSVIYMAYLVNPLGMKMCDFATQISGGV